MNTDRHTTEFSIRYAVRSHDRRSALWGRVAAFLKFMSIFSGSASIMSVIGSHPDAATALGLIFASFQALEYTLSPNEKMYESLAQRRGYAGLYANSRNLSDDELSACYLKLVSEDETKISIAIKELAYNDVVREQGLDESYCYPSKHSLRQHFEFT